MPRPESPLLQIVPLVTSVDVTGLSGAASRAQLPDVLWIVALIGSTLTIAYASAFVSSRYALLMIGGTSLTIGLLFLFLLSVDYPFRSRNGVSNEPLRELASIFARIDRSHGGAKVAAEHD